MSQVVAAAAAVHNGITRTPPKISPPPSRGHFPHPRAVLALIHHVRRRPHEKRGDRDRAGLDDESSATSSRADQRVRHACRTQRLGQLFILSLFNRAARPSPVAGNGVVERPRNASVFILRTTSSLGLYSCVSSTFVPLSAV